MGNTESLLTPKEIQELQKSTPFSEREVKALLKRYAQFAHVEERNQIQSYFLTIDDCMMIPQLSGSPYLRHVITRFMDEETGQLSPQQFVKLCALLSSKSSVQDKRKFLYTLLDVHKMNTLTYDEVFRLLKHLYHTSLSDDHILDITFNIVQDSRLTTPGEIQMSELNQLIPDNEVISRLTLDFHLT